MPAFIGIALVLIILQPWLSRRLAAHHAPAGVNLVFAIVRPVA